MRLGGIFRISHQPCLPLPPVQHRLWLEYSENCLDTIETLYICTRSLEEGNFSCAETLRARAQLRGKPGLFYMRCCIMNSKNCKSPIIDGAWTGRLVHLSGLDVIGPTAGSISRLIRDREVELWETKRIVSDLEASRFLISRGLF
jgi:hypothetical protein